MSTRWNKFKRLLKKEKEKTASNRTAPTAASTGKPYRKRFDSWEEHSKHYKKMSENKEHDVWAVKDVKEDRKYQLEKRRRWENSEDLNLMQFDTRFKRKQLEKALEELGVEKKDGTLIIGAGYIGKFARAFKPWLPWQKRYKIAFTDLNPEYVDMAKKGRTITKRGRIGLARKIKESFLLDLEKPHINDTKVSAIVSFEGVPFLSHNGINGTPEINSEKRLAISKNLGAKNGLIIFKGKLQKESGYPSWFGKTYGAEIKKVEVNKNISAYQIKINPKYKEMYLKDREAYEISRVNWNPEVDSKKLGISETEFETRVDRFKKAFDPE